ncbi:MAG: nuclear transport factor 2 family protein [Acidobacteriota bacterium]
MDAELERLTDTWIRAWLEKDEATVEKLMADEYIYIAPNGQVLDRQAILGIIRSEGYHLDTWTRTELVIRSIASDTAALVHRGQGEGSFDGKSFKDDHRCTTVCVRRDGYWQVILEHCSPNNQ